MPDAFAGGGPRRVCVFCGANAGRDPAFARAATEMAELCAAEGLGVVFGGGRVGLMGVVADAALAAGAEVIGVIPEALLAAELAHPGVSDMRVVRSMHERKQLMHDLSCAFVALPGGMGTLDELFEALTWLQLGFHQKPVGALDVAGYWRPLVALLDKATEEGLVRPVYRDLLQVASEPAVLLERMRAWRPPERPRWIGPGEN